VDTPFLPGDLVPQLLLAAEGSPEGLALAADATGDHPATALWPVTLAPALAAFLAAGEAKVTRFTAVHEAARALFPDPRAFLNLNSPEDLAAAEALLRGAA
jgi:molybdopterin-guanine dinucleotide biosynthesis protein A